MVEWTTETCRKEITKKDVWCSWIILVWNGLLLMALCRLIGKTCYSETALTHRVETTFYRKQNEYWLCSSRSRPNQVTSLQSTHTCFTLFVLECAKHSCFLWLLHSWLLGVRLMSTGIMETVVQGVTLARIGTTLSTIRILLSLARNAHHDTQMTRSGKQLRS